MDLNVKAANSLLSNPSSKDVKNILAASSNSTRGALSNAKTSLTNGSNGTSSSTRLQIIDESKNFTRHLSEQLEHWELADAGFDYDIVAVFGSQSTGKSTLLNRLFGTTFDVMNETQRQQTTKGIWMCKAKKMNVMVMDVEGTDGRERGEDQDFERKAALFSLASSEVLIVNLWEHQVGLYQGANMGLLKTVFEVNLSLFGKKSADGARQRTLLLFVIRDYIGATPLSNLSQTLTQDIHRIWQSISKPAGLENAQLPDYFDLSFTGLPHKVLTPEKFEAEVAELRKRFQDKSRSDYVFRTEYHKRIPADGVSIYMESIWEQVQTNKDLDLPTQQELLAQFRCDEISSAALEEFNAQAKPQRKPIEVGRVVEGLGAMMSGWVNTTFVRYDKDASRYHQGVYKKKRADLRTAMDNALSPLYLGQLKNLHKQSLVAFKKQLTDTLRGDSYNFADIVGSARDICEKSFIAGAREALLKDTDWSYEEELELLKQEISLVADQCRADETKKMVNHSERSFKKLISETVEAALLKATPTMWDDILTAYQSNLSKVEETYLSKARSFDCTEEENGAAISTIRFRAWRALRSKVDEQTADNVLLGKLRTHFEERFRYDAEGVPRVWKPEDDIDGAFRKARDETLELIPFFAKISPKEQDLVPSVPTPANNDEDEFDFESSLVVLTETKVLDLINRFRKDADAFYVEAKRSTVSSIAQIPVWMYGVLVVLGWNEAMAVLFNPLYFTMLLMGLAASYIIIQLGLVGPLVQVTRTVAGEVQRQAVTKLREQFAEPQLEPPMTASRNSTRVKQEEDDDEFDRQALNQRIK